MKKMDLTINEEKALAMLGGYRKRWKDGRTEFFTISDKENVTLRYSHTYDDGTGYWFGITSGAIDLYEQNKLSAICFVLGFEGIAKLPIELVKKYISNADKSYKDNVKKEVKHYHIRFKVIDSVVLYNSVEKFDVTGYMEYDDGVYRDLYDEDDDERLKKEAAQFKDYAEPYSGETTVKKRKESRKQKQIVARLEQYTCQVCEFKCEFQNKNGKKLYIVHVDHIIEKSKGGGEQMDNLWVLCPNCHSKKTFGVITIDTEKKEVRENNIVKKIRDNHLGW